ncbi:MAG: class I SAM-dependent methyltransferase [Pseudohongiellaceae bacterium]
MKPFFYLVFGDKADVFLDFKRDAVNLSDEEIDEYYDTLADKFIARDTDLNRQCLQFIQQNVAGKSVLDVACGAGFLSQDLAARGLQVTGADIVIPTSSGENPRYEKCVITELPFADKQFDTVVCTHTLEHIRDVKKALNEILRVCRKRLIVVVPCQREYAYTFDLHLHFFPYEYKLRKLVGSEGSIHKLGGDFLYIRELE